MKTKCPNCKTEINPAAMLGSMTSKVKTEAARRNAKRPRPNAKGKSKPQSMLIGELQRDILQMMNPEYPSSIPDGKTKRVLSSLKKRGMVYDNFGIWRITPKGENARKPRPGARGKRKKL